MMIFATPITIYANFDSSWSHIYSLFAITTFSYFLKRYFINTSKKDFFLACFFLGLIFILRQVNILVLLFVPFLAESYDVLKKRIINLFDNLGTLLIGLLLVFLICSFQFLVWYLQTGSIILYSYQNEGFNFMSPHFFDILFSYRKGLFVYTPALFIVTLSSLFLIFNKKVFVATSWFFAFIILTYILSSWWAWDYGCSYGSRPYIDYFVFFFLCLAIFIQKINNLSKYILFIIFSITIVLNIIQTYQYKHYILHWIEMDKTKYWDIFLKTEPRYRGILWKRNYNYTTFNKIKEVFLSDKHLTRNKITTLYEIDYSKIENSEKIKIIEVKFNNDFRTNNNSKFYVTIKDTIRNEILYYNENFLLSYREKKLNYYHTGLYNYEVSPITNKHAKLTVSIMPDNNFTIQNIIILFYTF
jgi:hypothetical protein